MCLRCLCRSTCVYPLFLCGAPTAQTLTAPPINTVRHASSNRPVFNHSCRGHVYGNTHVYVSNISMIAESICRIFPQIISDESPDWGSKHQIQLCASEVDPSKTVIQNPTWLVLQTLTNFSINVKNIPWNRNMHGIDLDPEQKHTPLFLRLWLHCVKQLCVMMMTVQVN